jgi:hypothetical protein
MSDKFTTFNEQKRYDGGSRNQEPTRINARLQWMAALVCALLEAENIKRSCQVEGAVDRFDGD